MILNVIKTAFQSFFFHFARKFQVEMLWLKALSILVSVVTIVQAQWYDSANFYQIYPRSFMDSNGDGVGDLQGIKSKLQYVKDLGIDGVWFSPIYKSPMADFGYDISDFRDIHDEFGTLQDFDEVLDECNRLGLKLILDFVPNHSSGNIFINSFIKSLTF